MTRALRLCRAALPAGLRVYMLDFAPFFCTLAISFELMLILASFFSPVGWD